MRVLHICNDYSYSKVYKNLYQELDLLGVEQIIYHPLRTDKNRGSNQFDFVTESSQLVYSSFLLKKYHRVFFRLKTNSLFKDLENQIDVSKVDISYPTTLFSDGVVAYKLYKKYKIPYIVAIRNTDINLFMKYRPDLLPLMHKILHHASKLIFISKGLKDLFYSKIKKLEAEQYKIKSEVISNGIDKIWLDNIQFRTNSPKTNRFLFVGRFDTNKNVENVIKSLTNLRLKHPDIHLDLIGGGGNKEELIKSMIEKNKDWIKYWGYIYDKSELIKIYRNNDYFVMPSIHETFGLVYIEALTQGLPILYTKNQGVDGLFDENIGIGTLTDVESIINSIKKMIESSDFKLDNINFEIFNWKNIAQRYVEILQSYKRK